MPPTTAVRRLFLAVPVIGDAAAALDDAIAPLRVAHPRARWTPVGHWHLTLRFVGPVASERVAALAAAARRVLATETAFSVVASGLGGFPSARRAEVVWIGFEDRGRGLAALAAALEDAVAPLVGPATRPFRPHLTAARSRPPLRLAPPATAIDPVVLPVREVRLMESHLHRSGARYDTLDTIALGDGFASEHLFG